MKNINKPAPTPRTIPKKRPTSTIVNPHRDRNPQKTYSHINNCEPHGDRNPQKTYIPTSTQFIKNGYFYVDGVDAWGRGRVYIAFVWAVKIFRKPAPTYSS
jgi:hypothetical protein